MRCWPRAWPFRLHATYDEWISRFLDVFEAVDREVPIDGLHWFFDHAETVTDRNLERIKALGGGMAIQHRMAYQGEYYIDRYGAKAAERTPPIARMLEMGIPGRRRHRRHARGELQPVGLPLLAEHRADRRRPVALPRGEPPGAGGGTRLYTRQRLVLERERGRGTLAAGQLADLAVLTEDYFTVPEGQIPALESVFTIVGGKVVYAGAPRWDSPPPLPMRPDWSPVGAYGGYYRVAAAPRKAGTPPSGGSIRRRTASRHRLGGCQADGRSPWRESCGCWAF